MTIVRFAPTRPLPNTPTMKGKVDNQKVDKLALLFGNIAGGKFACYLAPYDNDVGYGPGLRRLSATLMLSVAESVSHGCSGRVQRPGSRA